MVRNDDRRARLADAGIRVLAERGARGLTHRAVDELAGVPRGTASNYFRSRDELIAGLIERIETRITPDPVLHAELAGQPPTRDLFAAYLRDIVSRLTAHPEVTLAMFELRLEAARRPEVAERMGVWLRGNFEGDVAFNAAAGLPGGRAEIALFHYAIDGLLFDRLTLPIDPATPSADVVSTLVAALLPAGDGPAA